MNPVDNNFNEYRALLKSLHDQFENNRYKYNRQYLEEYNQILKDFRENNIGNVIEFKEIFLKMSFEIQNFFILISDIIFKKITNDIKISGDVVLNCFIIIFIYKLLIAENQHFKHEFINKYGLFDWLPVNDIFEYLKKQDKQKNINYKILPAIKLPKQEYKKTKKQEYEKEYQKNKQPEEDEPLTIYYQSLYKENGNSKSAIIWLTENGFFDGSKRTELIEKYKKIKNISKTK